MIKTNIKKHISMLLFFIFISLFSFSAQAQTLEETPQISYTSKPKTYEIVDIQVSGVPYLDERLLINFSGLEVGQRIQIPGEDITQAIKRFWKQGLFADVRIIAEKMTESEVWLLIELEQRPRISDITFTGIKKGQREDLESKILLIKGNQITPNQVNRTKEIIQKYYEEKAYLNTVVEIHQEEDISKPGHVLVEIEIDRKEKVKIKELELVGNESLSFNKINWVMKKTNPKKKWQTFFRTKK